MKANELMAGDYFRVAKDVCIKKGTVVEVRSIDADNNFPKEGLFGCASCRPLDENQFTGGVWIDYIEPIPLTAEILEKNGFKRMARGLEWKERLYGYRGQDVSSTSPIEIIYRDGLCGVSNPHIGRVFQGMIDYVHELQHALRLCGIDKEIVV